MSKYERPGWHDLDAGQAVLDEQQRLLAEAMAAEDAGDLALRDECLQDVLALTRIERIVEGMSRRRPSPAVPAGEAGKPAGRARQPRARKTRARKPRARKPRTPEAQS